MAQAGTVSIRTISKPSHRRFLAQSHGPRKRLSQQWILELSHQEFGMTAMTALRRSGQWGRDVIG
jgi:hypothetical protein